MLQAFSFDATDALFDKEITFFIEYIAGIVQWCIDKARFDKAMVSFAIVGLFVCFWILLSRADWRIRVFGI